MHVFQKESYISICLTTEQLSTFPLFVLNELWPREVGSISGSCSHRASSLHDGPLTCICGAHSEFGSQEMICGSAPEPMRWFPWHAVPPRGHRDHRHPILIFNLVPYRQISRDSLKTMRYPNSFIPRNKVWNCSLIFRCSLLLPSIFASEKQSNVFSSYPVKSLSCCQII